MSWFAIGTHALHCRPSPRMKNENPWIEICAGISRQTVAHGKTMYQMIAELDAGSVMPAHQHPQEQIVHLLSGRMKLIVDGTPHELKAGDSFYLASNVPHAVETIEPTRVLDTFSPPRDEYLAIDEANRRKL
jgi:quercetin dioxygenase-like cupin family protein